MTVRLLHPLYVSALQTVKVEDRVESEADLCDAATAWAGRVADASGAGSLKCGWQAWMSVDVTMVPFLVAVPINVLSFELRIKDHLTMVRRFELKPE